jgi:ubiquinol-cytochrome c reductase cytochrome b subunit
MLFVLPWLDTSKVRSMRYRPIAQHFFLIFVAACFLLGWCGAQNPSNAVIPPGQFSARLEWIADAQLEERPLTAADAAAMPAAIEEAEAALRASGADMVYIRRTSETEGLAIGAAGQVQSLPVAAANGDELETAIGAAKAQIGSDAPFVRVTRNLPFVFTVTRFAQVLTAYYFLFFLVILPLLGLRESPSKQPSSISGA